MTQIKRARRSPAFVIVAMTLVAAMVGTAIAGPDAITSKDKLTKNERKRVKKLADKRIAKAEPGLNVKSAETATTATSATRATSAISAATVGGKRIVEIDLRAPSVAAGTTILNLNGFQLKASCSVSSEALDAATTAADSEVASISTDAGNGDVRVAAEDEFDPGTDFPLGPGAGQPSERLYNINYTGGDGRNVGVQLVTDDDVGANDCIYTGFAIG